jgi:hypothetical protein
MTLSTLTLMGRVRNIFAVPVGRYNNSVAIQKHKFYEAVTILLNPTGLEYCCLLESHNRFLIIFKQCLKPKPLS